MDRFVYFIRCKLTVDKDVFVSVAMGTPIKDLLRYHSEYELHYLDIENDKLQQGEILSSAVRKIFQL